PPKRTGIIRLKRAQTPAFYTRNSTLARQLRSVEFDRSTILSRRRAAGKTHKYCKRSRNNERFSAGQFGCNSLPAKRQPLCGQGRFFELWRRVASCCIRPE